MKRRFLMLMMALLAGVSFAADEVRGRPNQLEGGYTYYYPESYGNTTNYLGHLPLRLLDYRPTLGATNVIYLSRSDEVTISTNYQFRGYGNWSGSITLGASNSGSVLSPAVTDGFRTFKVSNAFNVTSMQSSHRVTAYFTKELEGGEVGYVLIEFLLVPRPDAYYRVPRNDTYYVHPNTTLTFCHFRDSLQSPWVIPEENAGFTLTTNNVSNGSYDQFLITAAAGSTVQLRTADGTKAIDVHVVDENFTFTTHEILYRGPETRALSMIFYECGESVQMGDIDTVTSADNSQLRVVATSGDWELTAMDYFDVDREVTVTLKNGNVILLKFTSMSGHIDETFCANVLPKVVYGSFTNLLMNDNGSLRSATDWLTTTKTNNAPFGYTNVMRVVNCVLYRGKRYSVYSACKTTPFTSTVDAPNGQLKCLRALMKVVLWLEDENGDLFTAPDICVGNAAYSECHPAMFGFGQDQTLYTNDPKLTVNPYLGVKLGGTEGLYMGVNPDSLGYYAIIVLSYWTEDNIQEGHRDEVAVFMLEGLRTVEVRKEVLGESDGQRFRFQAEYTDLSGGLATNYFSLASGESYSLVTITGGVARVSEIVPAGCVASVRADETGAFAFGNSYSFEKVVDNHVIEFRNERSEDFDPIRLWITDHDDAGPGLVHLAFEPFYVTDTIDVGRWLAKARQRGSVRYASATTREGLKSMAGQSVTFRDGTGDRDITNNWVWITADVSCTTNAGAGGGFYSKITVDQQYAGYSAYSDGIIGSSAATGAVTRVDLPSQGGTVQNTAYVFTNETETARVLMKRTSRVRSVLLVGGGGAGGGGNGGGGGGGEVKRVEGSAVGLLNVGDELYVETGRGGVPAAVLSGVRDNTLANGASNFPGGNGGDSQFIAGDRVFTALGGGGGGSSNSTTPTALTPYGLGQPGGNGGGSAGYGNKTPYAPTGGVARATGGFPGGGGYNASDYAVRNSGAGGGGGMSEAGSNGVLKVSGKGGEGVTISVAGQAAAVYGSGGGGGASLNTTPGAGGTNAGSGGVYVNASNEQEPGGVGGDAVEGFGGGGGGGARWNDYREYRGGHGGRGKVVIELQDASVLDAVSGTTNIVFETANLWTQLLSDAQGQGVDVAFTYAQHGQALPAYQAVTNDAVAGTTIKVPLAGLQNGTDYDFAFKFTDAAGYVLVSDGTFTTKARDFTVGFENSDLVVSDALVTSGLDEAEGDYLLVANQACTNAKVVLKKDMTLYRSLVVGGGGAGGSFVGAGGGGGGVSRADELVTVPAGSEFLISVGAGGAAPNTTQNSWNESGEGSSLVVDNLMTLAALGGGAGAGRNDTTSVNGRDGANGGGGIGVDGSGGASTDGRGTSGGHGSLRYNGSKQGVPGGGGGARTAGGDGVKGTSRETSFAGAGGEGITCDITGEAVVYGSGGGGGADEMMMPALGGTNGGAGGAWMCSGGAGLLGTGGGGGGSGWKNNAPTNTYAGCGGTGTVVFRIATAAAPAVASVVVENVSPISAKPILRVLSLVTGVDAVTVETSFRPNGGTYTEWQQLAENVRAGMAVTNQLVQLTSDTLYNVRYRLTDGNGFEKIVEGMFQTDLLGFEIGYEDENLIVPAMLGTNAVRRALDGGYVLSPDACVTNAPIILKSDLFLGRAMLVGGGGAGGSYIGGGGGGGGVTNLVDMTAVLDYPRLEMGSTLILSTGAGGRSLGNGQNQVNENGGATSLTIGTTTYSVLGGGAGASQGVKNGADGANGGGGSSSTGVGGQSLTGVGFAGGTGGLRHDGHTSVTGGGGGAGEAGENGSTRTNANGRVYAGRGGMGYRMSVGGQMVAYGSGGGGGGDNDVWAGAGAQGAGDGGEVGNAGKSAPSGYGGGGGGAGYNNGNGGNGGSGTVVLQLLTPAAYVDVTNGTKTVVISEIMASNGETLTTADGTEGIDWIELRNDSAFAIDLADWFLSDSKKSAKWLSIQGPTVIEAYGTLIVWADKDKATAGTFAADESYIALNLAASGDKLMLFDPASNEVSRVEYPQQIKDISYGVDAEGEWGFFKEPTPGAYNTTRQYTDVTPTVSFSLPHGYYAEATNVVLSCDEAGREIRYTLDGSSPTTNSTLYTEAIPIARTTCLRAAVVDADAVLQNDTSATYVYVEDVISAGTGTPANFPNSGSVKSHTMVYGMNNLPAAGSEDYDRLRNGFTNAISTLAIVIDPKFLFDATTGIYVNCGLAYKGEAWERQMMFEQFDPRDAANEFTVPAGLRLRGTSSRESGNPKHSLRVYFRSRYGASSLDFPLFGDEGTKSFDVIDLRTEQNYSWARGHAQETYIHEVFSRDTQRDQGMPYTRSRYHHLFINGQYWGIYQTQERGNEEFAETYNGGKKENYDLIKTTGTASDSYAVETECGNMNAWSNLWWTAVREGFTGNYTDNYRKILGQNPDGTRNPAYPILLNQDNLIAFTINRQYVVDGDCPVSAWGGFPNNLYCFRDRVDDDKNLVAPGFFFLRHDTEHSMGTSKCNSYRKDYCRFDQDATGRGRFTELNKFNPDMLHYKLCDNAEYKLAFADACYRTCLRKGGALTDEAALARLRARMAELDDAIVCEAARWARNGKKRSDWLNDCNECLYFVTNRIVRMTNQFCSAGWYPRTLPPKLADTNGVALVDGQQLAAGEQVRVTVTGSGTTAYYTTDGSDPRAVGGEVAASATAVPADGLVTLPSGQCTLRVRARSSGGEWSPLEWISLVSPSANDLAVLANLRVVEVMGAPAVDKDLGEYIVLTNLSSTVTLNLEGARLTCNKPGKTLDLDITFPAGTTLEPGAELRLGQSAWWSASKIKNKDIEIKLYAATGELAQTAGVNSETWFADFEPAHPCDGNGYGFRALEFGTTVTNESQWMPVECRIEN